MKRAITIATILASPAIARATPTTNFWAPSTPAVQGYGVLHVGDDTYFATDALYPVDLGLTMGVIPSAKLQAEVGVDVLYPTAGLDAPVYFNAKLGTPEDAFFADQPALALGINALAGAGGGVDVYFTPTVGLLTGPVVFFEPALQPGGNRWMWSAQLDVDIDLGLAGK